MTLSARIRDIYYGTSDSSRRIRYASLLFDIVVVIYFVFTTFLPDAEWIRIVDYAIGIVMVIELFARLTASRDRVQFMMRPMTLIDIVVIASLLAPAVFESFVFLRVLRALRLLQSYRLLQELRTRFRFFARNEEVVFAVLHLSIFIFIVSALVFVLQADENEQIGNYVDALYFSIATLTTTGFGDITLTGSTGKLLSIMVMIVGISLFINLVRSIFRPAKVKHECSECGLTRHDPDAVHCKHCGNTLHIQTEGN